MTVTKRNFYPQENTSDRIAVLLQQEFVVVRERVRSFAALADRDQRAIPFREIEIGTQTSPPVDPHERVPAFWPQSQVRDILFDLVGTDWEGVPSAFSAPLLFVSYGYTDQAGIEDAYRGGPDSRRKLPLNEQVIAFAPSKLTSGDDGGEKVDAALKTQTLEFRGVLRAGSPHPFHPALQEAAVGIRELDLLTGNGPATAVRYHADVYLKSGFGSANPGEVFAEIAGPKPALALRADQAGGVGAPQLEIAALSRSLGPVGGDTGQVKAVATGVFPQPDGALGYFTNVLGDIKILGILPLKDLISVGDQPLGQLPAAKTVELPDKLSTQFDWTTTLKGQARLVLDVSISAPLPRPDVAPAPAGTVVRGVLTDFTLNLIPGVAEVMALRFERIAFVSATGAKSAFDATVADDGIAFLGPLSFLTEIKRFLGDSLGSPPGIDVSPAGVRVGYGIALPTIGVGVFVLQNVAISAELRLPFGAPDDELPVRFRFSFCTRHQPFLLTVSALGGGGFVALELGPDGIALLEVSLEFGAAVALNLGIASGSVSVMAGIYFRLELAGPQPGVSLTGYVRCNGSLEVLALVSISVEFYLGLTWKDPKAWGLARLTVEVEIAFFSKSVTLEVERQFSGTSADPTFQELMMLEDWAAYRSAFI